MTIDTRRIFNTLLEGDSLDESTARDLLLALGSGEVTPALAGGLLTALRMKGETAAEIRGFALGMRQLAKRPILPEGDHVDIVGTGGDASGSLNLSTGSALLAAACGASVVKHGNRSVSSRSGSADVLMSLGLPLPLDETASGQCLEHSGFTFLFAPHYHPAMQHIAPVRAALQVRTVFNILGPLTNPAEPAYHVIGAFSEEVGELMARTLAGMPLRRAFVVHGAEGWDEATPVGEFVCFDVTPGSVTRTVRDPLDVGIDRCAAADLLGGEPEDNCARLCNALAGDDTQAHRDALILGAALALEVTGRAASLRAGVEQARAALSAGKGRALLRRLAEFSPTP
ncbi:MAG: anthranilate phosphoribosyltransferase [Gammaproteobacteria bacterium]|jgi:anthranilate phosphoribosyltransferase